VNAQILSMAAASVIDRRAPISGAAIDVGLVRSIRDRLLQGRLPPVDGKVKAQLGTGHVCVICGESIRVPEVEYLPDQGSGLRAHPPCYTLWLVESESAKRRPREAGSRAAPRGSRGERQ
jgi:hypothetical protein